MLNEEWIEIIKIKEALKAWDLGFLRTFLVDFNKTSTDLGNLKFIYSFIYEDITKIVESKEEAAVMAINRIPPF